jgi:hypothetical protein
MGESPGAGCQIWQGPTDRDGYGVKEFIGQGIGVSVNFVTIASRVKNRKAWCSGTAARMNFVVLAFTWL